jgi:hypothetical protein
MQLNKAFESMTMKSSAATGPTGTLNFHNALRLLVAKNAGDTNSQLGGAASQFGGASTIV